MLQSKAVRAADSAWTEHAGDSTIMNALRSAQSSPYGRSPFGSAPYDQKLGSMAQKGPFELPSSDMCGLGGDHGHIGSFQNDMSSPKARTLFDADARRAARLRAGACSDACYY